MTPRPSLPDMFATWGAQSQDAALAPPVPTAGQSATGPPDTRPAIDRERASYPGTLDTDGLLPAGELERLSPRLQKELWRRWPALTEASAKAMTTAYFAAGRTDAHVN